MEFAIALLLTLAIAGSVLWVMPSPYEKKLDAFRKSAMSKGIRVRLLDSAMAAKCVPWLNDYRGYVLYEQPCTPGKPLPVKAYVSIRLSDDDSLHDLDRLNPLRQKLINEHYLEGLPSTCEALVFSAGGIAMVWREKGELDGVERILDVLKGCLALDDASLQAAS